MCVGARQSSVGTDQEFRNRQGWQTLEENMRYDAGIWGKEGGPTVLERRRSSFIRAVCFSKISLKLPQLEEADASSDHTGVKASKTHTPKRKCEESQGEPFTQPGPCRTCWR